QAPTARRPPPAVLTGRRSLAATGRVTALGHVASFPKGVKTGAQCAAKAGPTQAATADLPLIGR
ncbi:hypothetical protein ACFP9U_23780, partial [Nitratireductor sp. GCM10026969]